MPVRRNYVCGPARLRGNLSLGRLASADELPAAEVCPYAMPGEDPEAEADLEARIAARRAHHAELVERLASLSRAKGQPRKHVLHELERRRSQAAVKEYRRIMRELREYGRLATIPLPPSPDPSPATHEGQEIFAA